MSRATSPALTMRQFAFVTAAVLAAVFAHVSHLPIAISALVVAIVAASWVRHRQGGVAFPGWVKLAFIAAFLLILIVQYHTILGREPGSALACSMLALKLLETRARRDGFAAVSFASFALMSALLFSTSLVFTLATFLGVALLLAALRELQPQPSNATSTTCPVASRTPVATSRRDAWKWCTRSSSRSTCP